MGQPVELIVPDKKIKFINYQIFSLLIVYHINVENTTYEFSLIYKSFHHEMYTSE